MTLNAMARTKIHTNSGEATLPTKEPKNHLIPSLLRRECMAVSGLMAVTSHDTKNSSACAASKPTVRSASHVVIFSLFIVGM